MVNSTSNQAAGDNDELSLVDLASILLRRRRIFYVVFLVVFFIGIAYAIFAPEKYEYSSLVELAAKGDGEYVDKPSLIVASLENRWLPEVRTSYFSENEIALPFELVFKSPDSTGLVKIKSIAQRDSSNAVRETHEQLVQKIKEFQSVSVSRLREKLAKQIESLESTIEILQNGRDNGNALAVAVENKLRLNAMLDSIEPLEMLALSREGSQPVGMSKGLIVVFAGVVGLMLAIFSAFFVEFAALVKAKGAER